MGRCGGCGLRVHGDILALVFVGVKEMSESGFSGLGDWQDGGRGGRRYLGCAALGVNE